MGRNGDTVEENTRAGLAELKAGFENCLLTFWGSFHGWGRGGVERQRVSKPPKVDICITFQRALSD